LATILPSAVGDSAAGNRSSGQETDTDCQEYQDRLLVATKLVKPLAIPPPNSVKFFATLELLEQAKDRTWLVKITNALKQHWRKKNAAKRSHLKESLGRLI